MATKQGKSKVIDELEVSFKVNFIPKSEATPATMRRIKKEDIFGIQEIEIGKEDFLVVMGRTHIAMPTKKISSK